MGNVCSEAQIPDNKNKTQEKKVGKTGTDISQMRNPNNMDKSLYKSINDFQAHYSKSQLKQLQHNQILIPFFCKNKPEFSLLVVKERPDDFEDLKLFLKATKISEVIAEFHEEFDKLNQKDTYHIFDLSNMIAKIDNSLSLSDILDSIPFFFQTVPKNEVQKLDIKLTTITKQNQLFSVQSSSTIKNFKTQINKKLHFKQHTIQLFYKGKKLSDNKTFIQYNIGPYSNVHLLLRNENAIEQMFQPEEEKNESNCYKIVSQGPAHRKISQGLNVEGPCLNNKCAVYKKRVIASMEGNYVDLVTQKELFRCPVCQQQFNPEYVGLTNCGYIFVYHEFTNDKLNPKNKISVKESCREITYVGDQYKLFSVQSEIVGKDNFKIIIEPNNDQAKDGSQKVFCGICFGAVLDNKFDINFECEHLFHLNCWNRIKLKDGQNCILCKPMIR